MESSKLPTQIKEISSFHLSDLATMINYTEFFEDKIEITVADNAYELQDYYCKSIVCDCANNCTDIRFSVYENGEEIEKIWYNYKEAKLIKPSTYGYIIDKLKADRKDFDAILSLRHTLIKKTFEFFQLQAESAKLEQQTSALKNQIKVLKKTLKKDGQKVGRNEPCPCGSGKKYKKCCL